MPERLDTIAGERGARLSGGERQRIALARAVLRKPTLLLLDEATSALDDRTEQNILQRIAGLAARPTVVMISHRSSSFAHCDAILEVREGRIINARSNDVLR
jgi:ABC-type bacteriocin/lantibiotic exporter with double-glycine peptidase domain